MTMTTPHFLSCLFLISLTTTTTTIFGQEQKEFISDTTVQIDFTTLIPDGKTLGDIGNIILYSTSSPKSQIVKFLLATEETVPVDARANLVTFDFPTAIMTIPAITSDWSDSYEVQFMEKSDPTTQHHADISIAVYGAMSSPDLTSTPRLTDTLFDPEADQTLTVTCSAVDADPLDKVGYKIEFSVGGIENLVENLESSGASYERIVNFTELTPDPITVTCRTKYNNSELEAQESQFSFQMKYGVDMEGNNGKTSREVTLTAGMESQIECPLTGNPVAYKWSLDGEPQEGAEGKVFRKTWSQATENSTLNCMAERTDGVNSASSFQFKLKVLKDTSGTPDPSATSSSSSDTNTTRSGSDSEKGSGAGSSAGFPAGAIVGIIVGVLVLVIILAVIFYFRRKRSIARSKNAGNSDKEKNQETQETEKQKLNSNGDGGAGDNNIENENA